LIPRDEERYATLLRALAALSGLFSDNTAPYVDSRFVERLFVETSGAVDIGRTDKSFDAVFDDIGIGVKTFLGGQGSSKREKVAEFTTLARLHRYNSLGREELVSTVSHARNFRVMSDANELGLEMEKSFYHCLIRFPGGAIVHEEPYGLIDENNLRPTDAHGNLVSSWGLDGSGIYFTDGVSEYSYSTSKSVLFKKFNFNRGKGFIPLEIRSDPMAFLAEIAPSDRPSSKRADTKIFSHPSRSKKVFDDPQIVDEDFGIKGIDYVVLPLYSSINGESVVPERSGINQWNAAGRQRKFGESYIKIPVVIHQKYPNFLVERDVNFDLKLPLSSKLLSARVCQSGSKALMTNPNHLLGEWIVSVIDPEIPRAHLSEKPKNRNPFTYEDLVRIGKDSVIVRRIEESLSTYYSLEFAPLGSFEDFLTE
jgi:hypothetical protein